MALMGILYLKHARKTSRNAATRSRHAQNCYLMACRRIEEEGVDDARELLHRALQFDPEHAEALQSLANLEYTAGSIERAREYLDRLFKLQNPDAEAFFLRGNIELSQGNLTEALHAYRHAGEIGERTPELTFNEGLAHLMLGHGGQAKDIFQQLTADQPANGRAWDALGCALRLEKDYPAATEAFFQSLQADPLQNDVRDHMAQMLLEMGNTEQARLVLDAALTIEPGRASSRHLLGLVHATAQNYRSAVACWEELITQGGAMPETYHLLANAYLQLGERQKAISSFNTLLALSPQHVPGHLQLALLLLEMGEQEQGWHHLEQARSLDPQNPTVKQLVSVATAMRKRESPDR